MGNHYHKPERFKHGERFFAGEELVYNGELWVCLQDHIFYQMNWNRDYIDLYWQKV
jgi:hypothetical protein